MAASSQCAAAVVISANIVQHAELKATEDDRSVIMDKCAEHG